MFVVEHYFRMKRYSGVEMLYVHFLTPKRSPEFVPLSVCFGDIAYIFMRAFDRFWLFSWWIWL